METKLVTGPLKRTIYRKVKAHQGVCTIWDWNDSRGRYVQRTTGRRYHAYVKVNGKQEARNFESFEEAKRWRSNPGVHSPRDDKGLVFQEVVKGYFEHRKDRLRVTTLDTYQSKAKHFTFFNEMRMEQITPHVIDRWLEVLKSERYLELQHSTRMTYRHELSVLRQVFQFYRDYVNDDFECPIRKRHLEDSVVDVMKHQEARARNKGRYLTQSEIESFLGAISARVKDRPKYLVYGLFAQFQMRTGLRVGEVGALSWKNVDLEHGAITVCQGVHWARGKHRTTQVIDLTKTSESRRIEICPEALQALRTWQEASGRSHGIVFSYTGFEPLEYRCIQHQYNEAYKAAGIKWRSTHVLRHSFATDFLTRTRNQLALKELLGHKNMSQTEHYAKIVGSIVTEGIKAYGDSFRGSNVVSLGLAQGAPNGTGLVKAGSSDEPVMSEPMNSSLSK